MALKPIHILRSHRSHEDLRKGRDLGTRDEIDCSVIDFPFHVCVRALRSVMSVCRLFLSLSLRTNFSLLPLRWTLNGTTACWSTSLLSLAPFYLSLYLLTSSPPLSLFVGRHSHQRVPQDTFPNAQQHCHRRGERSKRGALSSVKRGFISQLCFLLVLLNMEPKRGGGFETFRKGDLKCTTACVCRQREGRDREGGKEGERKNNGERDREGGESINIIITWLKALWPQYYCGQNALKEI